MSKRKVFVLNIGAMEMDISQYDHDSLYHAILQDIADYNSIIFRSRDEYEFTVKTVFYNYTINSTNFINKRLFNTVLSEDVYPIIHEFDCFILVLSGHGVDGLPENEKNNYRFFFEMNENPNAYLSIHEIYEIFKKISKLKESCLKVFISNTCNFDANAVANQIQKSNPTVLTPISLSVLYSNEEVSKTLDFKENVVPQSITNTPLIDNWIDNPLLDELTTIGELHIPNLNLDDKEVYFSNEIITPLVIIGTYSSKGLAAEKFPGTYFLSILKGLLSMKLDMSLLDIYYNVNTIYQKSKLFFLYQKLPNHKPTDNPYFSIAVIQPFNTQLSNKDYLIQLDQILKTSLKIDN